MAAVGHVGFYQKYFFHLTASRRGCLQLSKFGANPQVKVGNAQNFKSNMAAVNAESTSGLHFRYVSDNSTYLH